MLRILLVILVVISSVLAVLLQMFELLGVAALLAVVLIGTWYMQWRKKKNRTTKVSEAKQEESSREAELAALGISEVRPVGRSPKMPRRIFRRTATTNRSLNPPCRQPSRRKPALTRAASGLPPCSASARAAVAKG